MPDSGSIISNTASFIPKTRLTSSSMRNRKGFDAGTLGATFILLVSLALFGGVYFYKSSLQKENDAAIASLNIAKEAFEPSLLTELSRLNNSINSAKTILSKHIVPSEILNLISTLALKEVFFSNFAYSADSKSILVKMAGEAKSYTGIALQAKIFEENDAVENVSFSNLSLKDAGKVGFNVELTVKPDFLIYKP